MLLQKSIKIVSISILLALLAACGGLKPNNNSRSAEALARKAMKFMGGPGALGSVRFLAFDYVVEQQGHELLRRSHTWDRKTGRYRLEGTGPAPEKIPYVALFNVNTREGKYFSGNKMEQLPDPRSALDKAYRDHLNDTAWLMGIFHLRDKGVELADGGQETISGKTFTVIVAVTSGAAEGTLPGHQNWIAIDPESGRPFAWSFIPRGQQAQATYFFSTFQPVGSALSLPIRFDRAGGGGLAIVFNRLISMGTIGDNIFNAVNEPIQGHVKPLKSGQAPLPLTR